MMKIYVRLVALFVLMVIPSQCAYSQTPAAQTSGSGSSVARLANPMAVYFPAKAKKAKMSGVVVVSCVVRGDGNFEACQVAREMPANYGFGAATVKMVGEIGKADLKINKPGDVVQATIKWTYSPDQ